MLEFLAFVFAVVAIVVAKRASNRATAANERAEALDREVAWLRSRVARASGLPVEPPPPPETTRPEPQPIPIYQPPPPPPPTPAPEPAPVFTSTPTPAPAASRAWSVDWENLVGIKLFSWIAGIALVLSAVFLFKYSVEHGWLRPPIRAGIGLLSGIALLVVCELRIARNYKFTANAMDGAGIAILYATLFSMHARWQLVPSWVSFLGMLVVTAAAVFLSTRRDSVFIALLGLVGGFATPALLSSGENRPIALFSYLLLLNGGISWIAFRKRWPLLTALSVGLTVFYQWAWVKQFLTTGQLPLAAGIFILFAVVGASALWPRGAEDDRQPLFRRIAAAAAVIPLIFAFFTAIVPEYGRHYNVLFGFLLLMVTGLAAIAILRGPDWLHLIGAVATLVTWFIWLTSSYTPDAWPLVLVWLAVFIGLYLAADLKLRDRAVHAAPLLFFVFVGLAMREEKRALTIIGTMLALLVVMMVFAIMRKAPMLAATALVFASITTIELEPAMRVELATQFVLLVATMLLAWLFEKHVLVAIAVLFYAATTFINDIPTGDAQLMFAAILFAPFVIYALLLRDRVKQFLAPHLAAALASVVFFIAAYDAFDQMNLEDWYGVLAVAVGLVFVLLTWRLLAVEANTTRLAMTAGVALAYFTLAIALQFEGGTLTAAFALEAAALAWLFTRIPHRGLVAWSAGLGFIALLRLLTDPVFDDYGIVYPVCAAAMYFAAYIVPKTDPIVARLYTIGGTVELFMLLNIAIADYYSPGAEVTFNFTTASLAQELTYTFAWALFAMAMLVTGIVLRSRGARVAALGLLLVTILKCFLHDLATLGGLYRVASLFGLAVSLVLVGLMLQKFVMMKREQPTA